MKPWEFEELTPGEWESIREGEKVKQWQFDLRTATICMVVANCHRVDSNSKVFTVQDFMPGEPHEQTPEDHLAIITALNAVLGGTDERKEG